MTNKEYPMKTKIRNWLISFGKWAVIIYLIQALIGLIVGFSIGIYTGIQIYM